MDYFCQAPLGRAAVFTPDTALWEVRQVGWFKKYMHKLQDKEHDHATPNNGMDFWWVGDYGILGPRCGPCLSLCLSGRGGVACQRDGGSVRL